MSVDVIEADHVYSTLRDAARKKSAASAASGRVRSRSLGALPSLSAARRLSNRRRRRTMSRNNSINNSSRDDDDDFGYEGPTNEAINTGSCVCTCVMAFFTFSSLLQRICGL